MTKEKRDDGGAAFPSNNVLRQPNGMSLRDYFAARAMDSLVTNGYDIPSVVSRAYALADAMLKARETR